MFLSRSSSPERARANPSLVGRACNIDSTRTSRTLVGCYLCPSLFFLLCTFWQGAGGPDFKRVNYEFDLDAESVQEIPTAVAHSLGDGEEEEEEAEDRERHTNYLMQVRIRCCSCLCFCFDHFWADV